MGDKRNSHKFWSENLKGRDDLKDVCRRDDSVKVDLGETG